MWRHSSIDRGLDRLERRLDDLASPRSADGPRSGRDALDLLATPTRGRCRRRSCRRPSSTTPARRWGTGAQLPVGVVLASRSSWSERLRLAAPRPLRHVRLRPRPPRPGDLAAVPGQGLHHRQRHAGARAPLHRRLLRPRPAVLAGRRSAAARRAAERRPRPLRRADLPLASDRLENAWWALALAAVWLLNPSVQWLAWETWHPETVAIPFFLGAYLMASRRRMDAVLAAPRRHAGVEGGLRPRHRCARHRARRPRPTPHGLADARRRHRLVRPRLRRS